jgi:hypothetical protein
MSDLVTITLGDPITQIGTSSLSRWVAQSFTLVNAASITGVTVRLQSSGATTGRVLNISLQTTDVNGKPAGVVLGSVVISGDGIGSSAPPTVITFGSPVDAVAGVYCVVLKVTTLGSGGSVTTGMKSNTPSIYPGGTNLVTNNSGGSWSTQDYDCALIVSGAEMGSNTGVLETDYSMNWSF